MISASRALSFLLILASAPALKSATLAPANYPAAIAGARRLWTADSREIAGLLRRMAVASDQTATLEENLAQSRKALDQLKAERAATLDEMRQGAFCTGCGRTRSYIEAHGETFPHAGQRSRPATPEELADAEKGFENRMDPLRRSIDRWAADLKTALAELTAAHHRFLVQLPVCHKHLAQEQENRLGKWLDEKTAAETGLKALRDALAAKAKAPAPAAGTADLRALLGERDALGKQLDQRLTSARTAGDRARQDERLFRKDVLASLDSLAAIACPIPDRHGVSGPFMATMIRNPPTPVGYTINAIAVGDGTTPTPSPGPKPASDLEKLLNGPTPLTPTPKPAGEKSVHDLLNGK